jgi:hypothetical protein
MGSSSYMNKKHLIKFNILLIATLNKLGMERRYLKRIMKEEGC